MKTNKWDKEIEFTIWAKAKMKEFNLTDWNFMCMQPFQMEMLSGKRCKNIMATCFPKLKWLWISQEFVYKFKLETSKDLFLHEIAHAVTGEGHTKKFRDFAKSIGCHRVKAKENSYIFDMFGRYDVTNEESIKACLAYVKKMKFI